MVPGASSHRVRARRGVLRSDAHPHHGVMPVESTAANVSSPSASHDGIMEKTEKREQIAKQFPKIALLRRMEASMGPGPDGPGKRCARTCPPARDHSFNGAGAGWPRKTERAAAVRAVLERLQWGRGRMAPENCCGSLTDGRGSKLQWGRGRMAPENRPNRARITRTLMRFNGAGAGWPRKTPGSGRGWRSACRFNGAGAGWPRKTRQTPRQSRYNPCCFNGAGAGWPRKTKSLAGRPVNLIVLQWGRGRMAPENPVSGGNCDISGTSFNGAGAGWPRKTCFQLDNEPLTKPRLQWGRGRMAPENLKAGLRTGAKFMMLQWGRGRMAPENCVHRTVESGVGNASMGPGPDGPGKPPAGGRSELTVCCFNGAGAGWPRKTCIITLARTGKTRLQWGRGRMAPENTR